MPVFYCIHCGQYLDADDDSAGQEGECPACLGVITVPAPRTVMQERPAVALEPEPPLTLPPAPAPEPESEPEPAPERPPPPVPAPGRGSAPGPDPEPIPPPPPIPASRFQVVIPSGRLTPPRPSGEEDMSEPLVKTEPVPTAPPEAPLVTLTPPGT